MKDQGKHLPKHCPHPNRLDADKFPNIKSLEGKTIIVTGQIKLYRNKPEIILNSPNQIKIVKQQ
jgi:DNA/RNA endonuclease YhcR with UshA esterase domain